MVYRIKSSDNQVKYGLRKGAKLPKEMYLDVDEVVDKDIYADVYLYGESSGKKALERADELEILLNRG